MKMEEGFSESDSAYMREAILLARNGEGRVAPNPPVGCVLVRDGGIIARGWHDRLGDLHAEAMALRQAGDNARGATAYVTLSPCTSHGRQPPCADALVRAGVAAVVIAATDPNPQNCSGADALRKAGVPVKTGLLRDEAEYLARGFFKMARHGLPYLTLKYAMTLDGRIAAVSGDSRWVSGPASRERVQDMRSRSDAILVGSGTAIADDPLLTVRDPVLAARGGPGRHPQPLRVVADSACRTPPEAAMLHPGDTPAGPVLIACVHGCDPAAVEALRRAGAEVLPLPSADGRVPLRALLQELARKGVNNVLCEGGGALAAGLLADGLVDEVTAFIAPKIIGGFSAPGPVGGPGLACMADAYQINVKECIPVGDDIMLTGLLENHKS